nr:uncharacterized mitochondrial protein AtMg00810-like [Tanacetum cinerariifolium]
MSMMGEMTFFLGLQVNQSPCGIFINQSIYVLEILKKYGMESCDPIGTPMEIKDKLNLDQNGSPVDAIKYHSMIGLWYTKDSGFELTGFSDADYARCKDTFKSTFGGAEFLGEKLVSWSSKKQDYTALSTAKAEYVSLSACCAQVLWMRTLLTDYGFHFNKIPIYYYSKSAIAISCNLVFVDDIIFGSTHPSLQVKQSPCGIFINQSNYMLEILKKYGMKTCDPVGTPIEIKDKLDLDQNRIPIDETKYRSMIGALMYLTSSRADIDSGFELTGFSDVDYAGCKDTFKSTSGGAQFLGEKLLTDYGIHFNKILIYCDLKSAIAISCNPVQHSKHIAVRYHFIKEHVEKGMIELYFVNTNYQLADLFTKALPIDRFSYLVRRLGMRSLSPQELERLAKSQ